MPIPRGKLPDLASARRIVDAAAYAHSVSEYRWQWRDARQARFERDLAAVIGVLATLMDGAR